jgi:hypothetical protein
MKSVGYAVLLAGLVMGAIVLCSVISKMSREECGRKCPTNAAALQTKFDIAGVQLVMCECGAVAQ